MIQYQNITNNCELVMSVDKKMKPSELADCFVKEIIQSDIELLNIEKLQSNQYRVEIRLQSETIMLIIILKNITGAGWSDKPHIKRVQVSNMLLEDSDFSNVMGKKKYNVIIGVYCYDNNPIIVAWDAYRYYNHNTIRSCYVTIDSLMIGYKKEFYQGVDSAQKIWIFKGQNFDKFLNSYVAYLKEFYKHE